MSFQCEYCIGVQINSEVSLVHHYQSRAHVARAMAEYLNGPNDDGRCDGNAVECLACNEATPSAGQIQGWLKDGFLQNCRVAAAVRARDEQRIGPDLLARVAQREERRCAFLSEVLAHDGTAAVPSEYAWYQVVEDLGTYSWNPKPPCNNSCRFDPLELLSRVELDMLPPFMVPPPVGVVLPNLPESIVPAKFPFEKPVIAQAAVAALRGVDVASQVHVVLGSGSLRMLCGIQKTSERDKLWVQRCGRTLFVQREHPAKNLSDIGFMVERLCTGLPAHEARIDSSTVEHLSLATLGSHRLLISGEVDAVAPTGELVELKSGTAGFQFKAFAQAMVSGSARVVNVEVQKTTAGKTVQDVDLDIDIAEELKAGKHPVHMVNAGKQAKFALDWLRAQPDLCDKEGLSMLFQIHTDQGLSLKPSQKCFLPPTPSSLERLLSPNSVQDLYRQARATSPNKGRGAAKGAVSKGQGMNGSGSSKGRGKSRGKHCGKWGYDATIGIGR